MEEEEAGAAAKNTQPAKQEEMIRDTDVWLDLEGTPCIATLVVRTSVCGDGRRGIRRMPIYEVRTSDGRMRDLVVSAGADATWREASFPSCVICLDQDANIHTGCSCKEPRLCQGCYDACCGRGPLGKALAAKKECPVCRQAFGAYADGRCWRLLERLPALPDADMPIVVEFSATKRRNSYLVSSAWTVAHLGFLVCAHEGIPTHQIRFIFRGERLDESETLGDYYIQRDDALFLMLRLRGD